MLSGHHTKHQVLDIRTQDPISLEQIIMTQKDEPNQKNCIFKLQSWAGEGIEKFYQIRVKSIKFHEEDGIAIYYYDITS